MAPTLGISCLPPIAATIGFSKPHQNLACKRKQVPKVVVWTDVEKRNLYYILLYSYHSTKVKYVYYEQQFVTSKVLSLICSSS